VATEKKEEVNEVTAYMHRKYQKVSLDFFVMSARATRQVPKPSFSMSPGANLAYQVTMPAAFNRVINWLCLQLFLPGQREREREKREIEPDGTDTSFYRLQFCVGPLDARMLNISGSI
jgi:hypothetical protein